MKRQVSLRLLFNNFCMCQAEMLRISAIHNLDLMSADAIPEDRDYYPQIEHAIRKDAQIMSRYYEIIYSIEQYIRGIIVDRLQSAAGVNWWDSNVPEAIRQTAKSNMQKELDAGVTLRSTREIDYTNFGDLQEIIKTNWDHFSDIFSSKQAISRILANLNTLRSPVFHCSMLAEDEVNRLQLSLRDLFRAMS